MSIEKEWFGFVVNCDGCSDYYTHDIPEDFIGAIDAVKSYGWKMRKDDDGAWEHFCPECAKARLM